MKLPEKGCKQRSDRGFGPYTEAKMGRKNTVLAAHKVLLQTPRDFSKCFCTEYSEVQLRAAERRRVRRVMSSSCSQPSPTKA
jgi:hypothetical protein